MGKVIARPAQGNNQLRPYNRPRPAYLRDNGTPTVVSRGTQSHPKDIGPIPRQKILVTDKQPKVVQL